MDEEVEIIDSPRSAYIVRSRPTILSCKALNAQRVRFKCNSKWVSFWNSNFNIHRLYSKAFVPF